MVTVDLWCTCTGHGNDDNGNGDVITGHENGHGNGGKLIVRGHTGGEIRDEFFCEEKVHALSWGQGEIVIRLLVSPVYITRYNSFSFSAA